MRQCPKCGRQLDDDALFCPACGTPAAPDEAQERQPREMPGEWGLQSPPAKSHGRGLRLALGLAAVFLLGFAIALLVLMVLRPTRSDETVERRMPLMVPYEVEGLDGNGTRIPVLVEGSTASGQAIKETAYVDHKGKGLELAPGVYDITVMASPISDAGQLYSFEPKTTVIEAKDTGDALLAVEPTSGLTSFAPIDPIDLSEEVISDAQKWAEQDPDSRVAARVPVLTELARTSHDAAVEERRKQEEPRKEESEQEAPEEEGETETSEEEAIQQQSPQEQAVASIGGWWADLGGLNAQTMTGYRAVYHVDGSTFTAYDGDGNETRGTEIDSANVVRIDGEFAGSSTGGWYFRDLNRFLGDGQDMLTCINEDGTGYSGTSSWGRLESAPW